MSGADVPPPLPGGADEPAPPLPLPPSADADADAPPALPTAPSGPRTGAVPNAGPVLPPSTAPASSSSSNVDPVSSIGQASMQTVSTAEVKSVEADAAAFFSFSRADMHFVERLNGALIEANIATMVEWQERKDLQDVFLDIEQADVFISVISPAAVVSEPCNLELDHALTMGKRIIPAVCKEVAYHKVRKDISSLDWVFFPQEAGDLSDEDDDDDAQDQGTFEESVKLIVKAIRKDLSHCRMHTSLLLRALEFDNSDFDESLLLRDKECEDAQSWLYASATGVLPRPTGLHLSLITESLGIVTKVPMMLAPVNRNATRGSFVLTSTKKTKKSNNKASVFVCYHRGGKDGALVDQLHEALVEDGRTVLVDHNPIPNPPDQQWLSDAHSDIEQADVFVFVLSPRSVQVEALHWQLDHAVDLGKRIVPVVLEEVDLMQLRKELVELSSRWLFFRFKDNFDAALQLLKPNLDEELDHLQYHTKLVGMAVKWRQKGKDSKYLLGANETQRATDWMLYSALGKEPRASQLIIEFLRSSQKKYEKCTIL